MMPDITDDEIVAEIQAYLTDNVDISGREPGTITRVEMEQTPFNLTEHKARQTLRQLVDNGILDPVYVWRTDDWGVRSRRRGYKLADKDIKT